MKILNKIIIHFLLLCHVFLIALGGAPITVLPDSATIIDRVYIIRYVSTLTPNIILDRIKDAGINYTHRYNLEIVDSVSLKFNEKDDVIKCSKLPGIERISPVRSFKPRLFTAHKISGIDVFRKKTGLDGTGVKVGIIDNGIDYTHPAFGRCFKTPGCKTQFGTDLIGSGDSINPVPDNDPLETCEGHGTHVAGIVAADDHELNFTGVAPGVTLGIYRAIDCQSSTADDIVIQALQFAAADNVDIINLSLGGNFRGWNDTAVGDAVNKLAVKGFVIVVASSNLGTDGLFTSGDPDSSSNIISVGEVDNKQFLSEVLTISSDPKKEIQYVTDRISLKYRLSGSFQIDIANTTKNLPESDGCNPYNKDLTNKIALIRRGDCDFGVKASNAVAAGAVSVLFYNNDDSLLDSITFTDTPDGIISKGDGEYLKEQIRMHKNLTVSFPDKRVAVPLKSAGKPSNESSWGPTFEFDIKPDFLAPGGRIFSTYPINLGKYATISGTSMAAAYTSGTIALYLQATGLRRGDFDSIKLRDLLLQSSTLLCNHTDDKYPISVNKQGGGLLNIAEALKTKAIIEPSKLLLNDSAHFVKTHEIRITNTGKKTTKYTFDHIPTKSVRGWFNNTWVETQFLVIEKHFAGVKLSRNSIIVRPKKTVKLTVKFTQPRNMPNDFGIYSGYISVKDSVQQTISTIPYLGVKGNIYKIPMLSNPDFFRLSDGETFSNETQIGRFTFIGNDFPIFEYTLNYGTRFTVIKLFKRGDFTSSGFIGLPVFDVGTTNPSIQFPRNGPTSPVTFKAWSSRRVSDFNGENQFIVPSGQYQAILTILKPFGNPKNEDDFVNWRSAIIEVIDSPNPSNQTTSTNQPTTVQNTPTSTTTPNRHDVPIQKGKTTVLNWICRHGSWCK